jgi:hypothetical protein
MDQHDINSPSSVSATIFPIGTAPRGIANTSGR